MGRGTVRCPVAISVDSARSELISVAVFKPTTINWLSADRTREQLRILWRRPGTDLLIAAIEAGQVRRTLVNRFYT